MIDIRMDNGKADIAIDGDFFIVALETACIVRAVYDHVGTHLGQGAAKDF